jgi:4'-phosphopantetheinyl transferase
MPIYQINNVSDSLKLGVWKITETEDELLKMFINLGFDKSNIYPTKNKQRLKQWLATRVLLAEFFNNTIINYDSLGKPHLDNGWFISISHSNEFVALNLNKKSHCGIDIERISPKVERIKHKFLNPSDLKKVNSLEHLTLYWGAKEALYKYYGKKEVLFIENLFIEEFSEESFSFKGKINMPNLKITLPLKYQLIEGYILTYTL